MPVCPACEADNLPGTPACRRCGLSTDLFEPIRSAVGLPRGDPRYETQVRELIEAMGSIAVVGSYHPAADAELAAPSRFPSIPPSRAEPGGEDSSLAIHELPKRPDLPPPGGIPALRRQIDDYLRLARRQGLDETALIARARELAHVDEEVELEKFTTDLFVRVAASLTESYSALLARRSAIAELVPTDSLDANLGVARGALERGDLDACERTLREVEDGLDRAEDEWGPAEVLLRGAQDLSGAIRDLGGDPASALGPIEEGRRLIRSLERGRAESVLARGTVGLWTVLNPLLEKDLARRIGEVRAQKAAGADVEPVLRDLKEFGSQVRQRNFSAAVAFYRRGVDRLTQLSSPPDGAAPSLNIDRSVPPA